MAISGDELVHIVGDLTPVIEKTPPSPGIEWFDGKISIPITPELVKATFRFKDGLLYSFSLSSQKDDRLVERLAAQVAERYGPGKVEDDRKEEQCIYRNGNSFTLKSGLLSTYWTAYSDDGRIIETRHTELDINSCPANLRDGSTGGIKVTSFSIGIAEKKVPDPKKNLF